MRIAIIGGGISGLTLAWSLRRRYGSEAMITLVEQGSRLGGWIQTVDHDGFLFELGPRSCRPGGSGAATLRLIEALGMEDQVVHAAPAAKQRYLCLQGQLTALPSGFLSCLWSRVMRPILPALMREWRLPKAVADESIHSFISRRLGGYAADYFFDPLTLGIYAGDCRRLSMKSCFPQLWQWEQTHGSLTRGMFSPSPEIERSPFVRKAQRRGLFTLRQGMEQLVRGLQQRLEVDVLLGQSAAAVEPSGVRLSNGELIQADACYVTVPANGATSLFARSAPPVSRLLAEISHATVTVVSLGYNSQRLQKQGFGYLVPSWEQERILGVVWDSSVYPQHNRTPDQTRLTVMMSGEPPDALAMACGAVERHLGICVAPDACLVAVRRHAIPQYEVGHSDRLIALRAALTQALPNVWLGSCSSGVAVNDCIARVFAK